MWPPKFKLDLFISFLIIDEGKPNIGTYGRSYSLTRVKRDPQSATHRAYKPIDKVSWCTLDMLSWLLWNYWYMKLYSNEYLLSKTNKPAVWIFDLFSSVISSGLLDFLLFPLILCANRLTTKYQKNILNRLLKFIDFVI